MSAELKFIDTNILVYLYDNDSPAKQSRSRELLETDTEHYVLSPQVLSEFYVTVTRKLARPLAADQALEAVNALCALRIRQLHGGLVRAAIRRSLASRLSYWDALVVETAIEAGAAILLTEDLQHGQTFDELLVVNPYATAGETV